MPVAITLWTLQHKKIKYMGTSEDGGLKFERLIPVAGINTTDKQVADVQLAHLKKVLKPTLY